MKIRFLYWLALLCSITVPLRAQQPIDAGDVSLLPSVFAETGADGSLDVAWRAQGGQVMLSTFSGPNYSSVKQFKLGTNLKLLGGLTRDADGNRYVAVFRDEKATAAEWQAGFRTGVANILKIAPGAGNSTLFANVNKPAFITNQNPIVNPLHMDDNSAINSELVFANNSLFLGFGHNNGIATDVHNTGALIGVGTNAQPTYSGGGQQHTGHIRLAVDGKNTLMAQTFDQGLGLSILKPSGDKFTWSDFVLIHEAPESQHIFIAGIVPTPTQYLVIFTSGGGGRWMGVEYEAATDGNCAIMVMKVARDFDKLPKFDWWPAVDDPSKEYLRHAQGNYRLTKVAAPAAGKSYLRPLVSALPDGRSIVAFEQWGQQKAEGTRAVLLDANGNFVKSSQLFAGVRIQKSTRGLYLSSLERMGWVSADAAQNQLLLHTLDADLNLTTIALGKEGSSVAPKLPEPRALLTVDSIPGRYVRDNPENGYHEGTIEKIAGVGGAPATFRWTNKSEVKWGLSGDLSKLELTTDRDNPYYDDGVEGCRTFFLKQRKGTDGKLQAAIDGFTFLGEFYRRVD